MSTGERGPGRPTVYDPVKVQRLLELLSEGKSLRKACSEEGMPGATTVLAWALNDNPPGFSEQYANARRLGYELMADELVDISDGETAKADPQRDRLRVDTRKWQLSKMLPKVYGDKVVLSDPDGGVAKVLVEFVGARGNDPDAA